MKLVYIAARFTGPNAWAIAENVRRAERMGYVVTTCGAWPVIPHANTQHFHGAVDADDAYAGTMEMMRRCDGIIADVAHVSVGVTAELKEAEILGIPALKCDGDFLYPGSPEVRRFINRLTTKGGSL